MTITPQIHRTRAGYFGVTVAIPLLLFGAGTAPAYADHHEPAPPWEDPIIADFSPPDWQRVIMEQAPCLGCPPTSVDTFYVPPLLPELPVPDSTVPELNIGEISAPEFTIPFLPSVPSGP